MNRMRFVFCRLSWHFILLCIFPLIGIDAFAQKGFIKGQVKDKVSAETIIGANVIIKEGVGAVSDIDGNYTIEADPGDYTLRISFVGFVPFEKKVTVSSGNTVRVDAQLSQTQLSEIEVVSEIAKTRETPVAFTTIPAGKIQEEIASRDLPMILNKTPGVYATQSGGGEGDARINIRGFNQRNVAVMFDGIPMNDMENGWVYWSNWFGTDQVTRTLQVTRGLGASKLALPAVGGTINIITKGIDEKRFANLQQEVVVNDDFSMQRNDYKTTVSLGSGKLKGGWGITAAGSFKGGKGWVDQTGMKAFSWFGKVEKKIKTHVIALTAFGAPQQHSQRTFNQSIATFDTDYALHFQVDTNGRLERGIRFNPHWGNIRRTRGAADSASVKSEYLPERKNYFHKPVFSLKDFWSISDRLYWSNLAYASFGKGGGTSSTGVKIDSTGQYDFQSAYDANAYGPYNAYEGGLRKSTAYLRSSVNNHNWYGFLSSVTYTLTKKVTLTGGLDLRTYKGVHYREVYDLLGGDIVVNDGSDKTSQLATKTKGDKIDYYNDAIVKWGGLFVLAEYKTEKISCFVNASGIYQGYNRVDYFKKKDLEIHGHLYKQQIGYNDVLFYNHGDTLSAVDGAGKNYFTSGDSVFVTRNGPSNVKDTIVFVNPERYDINSSELSDSKSGQKWIPGYTLKGGVNYNVGSHINAFGNIGYLNRTPRFANVIDNGNMYFRNIENEKVKAFELGVSYHSPKVTANLNGYYTIWENKPLDRAYTVSIDEVSYSVNVNGINALHTGLEYDMAWNVIKPLTLEGMVSFGDWRWTSSDTAFIYDDNGNQIDKVYFDAKGVHVGDAAQFTYSASARVEPIRKLYVKIQYTFFGKNFANFNPTDLKDENAGRESWKMPDYYLMDLFVGYSFKIKKSELGFRAGVTNLLNKLYVSDAINNDSNVMSSSNNGNSDANSAGVFLGLGRKINFSLSYGF